jgi:hypothetical protein
MPYREIIPKNPNITDLLAQIKNYYHQEDIDMVRLAYDFAEKAH